MRRFTLLAGKNRSALVDAAEFHFQLGRFEDAFELASRCKEEGFSSKAQRILGLIHFQQARFTEAIFHLNRADEDAQVSEKLLLSYLAVGDLTQAENRLGGWKRRVCRWRCSRNRSAT